MGLESQDNGQEKTKQENSERGKESQSCTSGTVACRTINDLSVEDAHVYRDGYIYTHRNIITRCLGHTMPMLLCQGLFGRLFLSLEEVTCKEEYTACTAIRFSREPLRIPRILHYAEELLLRGDLTQRGIFRVNSTSTRISAVRALISDIVEGRVDAKDALDFAATHFDIIDFAETYKQILRSFNTTAIPSSCIPVIKAITRVADMADRRVCTRALFNALPSLNRAILENNIRLCRLIVAQATNPQQMDMAGLSKVMMPCLILHADSQVAIEDILILAEFIRFLFTDFEDLIYI